MSVVQALLASTSATDPYWTSVVSLLNFIGADGATSTVDNKGLSWTFNGNAQIDTAASVNGVSSLLLDGTGDFIATPDTAALRTDISVFTMEVWARVGSPKLQTLLNKRAASSAQEFSLYANADNTVTFNAYAAGVSVLTLTSSGTLSTSAFRHVEVGRNGTQWYLFVNGVLEASGTQSGAPTTNAEPFRIGRDGFNTTRDFNGWIGGFRRTNGVIRHTAGFTPPSAPFPTS